MSQVTVNNISALKSTSYVSLFSDESVSVSVTSVQLTAIKNSVFNL